MPSELTWKNIELHVDNLIPGLILSGELLYLHGLSSEWNISDASFSEGAVFVAASYGFGVISAGISRFFVDGASELGLRALALELLAHGKRTRIKTAFESEGHPQERKKFSDDLKDEEAKWKRFPGSARRAEWNAIYRSALRRVRANNRREIGRRRAQGRLVRNLFLPVLLGTIAATRAAEIGFAVQLTIWLSAGLFVLLLYAYAELNTFAEAHDIAADFGQNGGGSRAPKE